MNIKTFAVIATVIGLGLVGAGAAEAYRGDPNTQGPNYSPERHQAMVQAFENNDFQAWKELMGDRGPGRVIESQEEFGRFTEMRQLRLEGKHEEANQIAAELGLGQGMGRGNGVAGRGAGYNGNCPYTNQ